MSKKHSREIPEINEEFNKQNKKLKRSLKSIRMISVENDQKLPKSPNQDKKKSFLKIYFDFLIDVAERSGDNKRKVSSMIINNKNQILGFGYNGETINIPESLAEKYKGDFMVHAEVNAVTHCSKNLNDEEELFFLTTRIPCSNCMKLINQYKNIKAIIYFYSKNNDKTYYICKENNIPLINYYSLFCEGRDEIKGKIMILENCNEVIKNITTVNDVLNYEENIENTKLSQRMTQLLDNEDVLNYYSLSVIKENEQGFKFHELDEKIEILLKNKDVMEYKKLYEKWRITPRYNTQLDINTLNKLCKILKIKRKDFLPINGLEKITTHDDETK